MQAIYKRDMRSYFVTPTGYVFLAIFYAMSGYYFFATQLYSGSADFSSLFGTLFTITIFVTPLLTMKMFSEEKKYKTDQGLITAPVSLWKITLGKYFASLTVFALALSVTLIYLILVLTKAPVELAVFFGQFMGMFLLGAALCAVGMFVSVLTESQVISAIGSIGFGIFFISVDSFGYVFGSEPLSSICKYLSFYTHFEDFSSGLLNIADVVFFLSIAFLFCFLTVKVLDKKRWA